WPGRLAQIRQALEMELRQQNWTAAQRIVDSAGRAYPDTAFAPFLAGIVELAQGHAGEAERSLSESLKSAPRSPVIATALAKAWSRKNGAAFAGERLMGLAERDGGFAFARYLAAHAFVDARDPAAAAAAAAPAAFAVGSPFRSLASRWIGLGAVPRRRSDPRPRRAGSRRDRRTGRAEPALPSRGDLRSRKQDGTRAQRAQSSAGFEA